MTSDAVNRNSPQRERREFLLRRYREVADAILVAVDHLPEPERTSRPNQADWSANELVHHLADAELHDGAQLRRILAENTPVLHRWDPEHYAEKLHYDRPIATSLKAFHALAMLNIELLHVLDDQQWRREANDQRPWQIDVETWLEDKVRLLNNQLMQLINAPAGNHVIENHPDFMHHLLDRIRNLGHT